MRTGTAINFISFERSDNRFYKLHIQFDAYELYDLTEFIMTVKQINE